LYSYIHSPSVLTAYCLVKHRDSFEAWYNAVGTATAAGSDFESRQGQELSLLHIVKTGFGANPTSRLMGTAGSFPGGKTAGAFSSQLTSNQCPG
jgi:hypothetical protein